MKTHIKNKEEGTKILRIEIPHDLVEKAAEEVYQEIKKIAKIPGFRVGSAPQDLLEKHYSKDAKAEILKKLIPAGYRKAVENHKVSPIGLPQVFNISFEKGEPLTFEAEVDIRPSIKLRNYKGIKIKKKKISLSQQEIDDVLSRMRKVKENALKIDTQNQILDRLLRDNKFTVPAGIVQRQKEVLVKRFEAELLRKGLHKDEVAKKLDELDQKLGRDARDKVRIYFILDDIALKERIEISDRDIDEKLKSIAVFAGKPQSEVRKYYEKENLLGGLAEEVKETKVLEFLLKEAEVVEIVT